MEALFRRSKTGIFLGSKMEKADSLSRRLDWEVRVDKDNEDKTLVKL